MSRHTHVFIVLTQAWFALSVVAWLAFCLAKKERRAALEQLSCSEHCACYHKGLYCCECLARKV